mgnify:CR=1 FL=1
MKMHFGLRKWLRCAVMPNLSDDFEAVQEAQEAAKSYLKQQLPQEPEESCSASSASSSQQDTGLFAGGLRRSSTVNDLQSPRTTQPLAHSQEPEGQDDERGFSMNVLLRERSISDLLNDRHKSSPTTCALTRLVLGS